MLWLIPVHRFSRLRPACQASLEIDAGRLVLNSSCLRGTRGLERGSGKKHSGEHLLSQLLQALIGGDQHGCFAAGSVLTNQLLRRRIEALLAQAAVVPPGPQLLI